MAAYYNEINPYAAQWLRNLIAAGHIADGDVDERSIADVRPDDLRPYTQCHFFAGIGAWSYALRLAGWPDDKPVWTGSCPCQPFSVAGQGKGTSDERHLWPVWYELIKECQPTVIFGEQVEAAIRHGWLDLVQDDLESSGYTFGAICLPAACTGAPHIRQRLWFVADSRSERCDPGRHTDAEYDGNQFTASGQVSLGRLANTNSSEYPWCMDRPTQECRTGFADSSTLGDAYSQRRQQQPVQHQQWQKDSEIAGAGTTHELGNSILPGLERHARDGSYSNNRPNPAGSVATASIPNFWDSADWLYCRDGKYRPVESGTFPLAHGVTNRVGRLCAYGNAINPQTAAEVIGAYMEY